MGLRLQVRLLELQGEKAEHSGDEPGAEEPAGNPKARLETLPMAH